MNSGPHLRIIIPPAIMTIEQPRQTLRLKLKPKAPVTGYVDGAWWPRSRNLSAELPALLAVLAVRLGRIQRVSYNLTAWDAAPSGIVVGGQSVRLGGFHSQDKHTVDVIGPNGTRITLLVVPPETGPETARQVLLRAARRGNVDKLGELLTSTAGPAPVATTGDPPSIDTQRWELDGGRGYDPVVMYRIPRPR